MFELFWPPVRILLKSEPVRIDNVVFSLHSRVTVVLLTICAIIVTAKQYFGEAITCIPTKTIPKEAVNAYCWIYSTFTVTRHLGGTTGRDVAAPGVGPIYEDDELLHHRYYQWVCFVLALQAFLFYAPRALWGVWEAGTIGHLAKDLASPIHGDAWSPERKRQLVEYFAVTTIHNHNFYAFRFLICELLNFLNAVGQIYLLNVFLEGQFSNYGAAVTAFTYETQPDRVDPMARLFPKVTKCTIHRFGASGSLETVDALCVLPLNVANERIFVFLWFWLIFLASISGLAVCYRIIVFTQPWVRMYLLRRATNRVLHQKKAEVLVKDLHFGDWFLLYQLAHNVNFIVYGELLNEIADTLTDKCFV